jgi:hypothetical protein
LFIHKTLLNEEFLHYNHFRHIDPYVDQQLKYVFDILKNPNVPENLKIEINRILLNNLSAYEKLEQIEHVLYK